MSYAMTVDGMTFDLRQDALYVSAQSTSISFDPNDISQYFNTSPIVVAYQFDYFLKDGVINLKGSSGPDAFQLTSASNIRYIIDSGAGDDTFF